MTRCAAIAASLALAGLCLAAAPVRAQGLIEFLRRGANSAPPTEAEAQPATPLSIMPTTPAAGDLPKDVKADPKRRQPVVTPVPTGNPFEEDEDGDVVFEHETPKLVKMALPEPRPGARPVAAAEVAPVGTARWSEVDDQLPPDAQVPGLEQSPPLQPRIVPLPGTPGPSWFTEGQRLRPPGMRQSEEPVASMPGVYAPPEAIFDCLPDTLKQVLLDTAKEFGHVAILNARRPRGTGARESYHYQCRAVDFRVRGVPISTVYAYLKQHPNVGGRKIYPFGFFHVDDGPSRSW